MMSLLGMPWRPQRSAHWDEELASAAAAPSGAALRRLANQRLGPVERMRLHRLLASMPAVPELTRLTLALFSNRTVDLLGRELTTQAPARGLMIRPLVAGYATLPAIASGRLAWTPPEPADAALVLLDEDAFLPPGALLDAAAETSAVDAATRWLQQIVAGVRRKACSRVLVATVPTRMETRYGAYDAIIVGAKARFIGLVNDAIRGMARYGEVIVIDLAELAAAIGWANYWDPVHFHLAKGPVAPAALPLVADRIGAVLAASYGKSCRVLALDLDNTLWGGVIADDGCAGIAIGNGSASGEAYLAMQRWARELRRRGVVLTVVSKNSDEIAREPFERHPDMALRLEEFALFCANWSDKATNLKTQAEQLRLGLENFVFVDDNPAERERVRQALPMVAVPEIGSDPAFYPMLLSASGYFEAIGLSAEDLGRADAYAAERDRATVLAEVGDYGAYLASLDMTMTIAPFDATARARIAQLINKSNQFNLTTRRYTEDEVADLERANDAIHWQVRLADRFGDHGMIAVVIVRAAGAVWSVDSWLMSCRVLERGVEQALMNALVARAADAGIEGIEGRYVPTPRNGLVRDFFDRMRFARTGEGADGTVRYRLDVAGYQPFETFIALKVA